MSAAFVAGMALNEFWGLTPWQLKICLQAFSNKQKSEHDQSSWLMWHGAALARVEKMPPLDKFLTTRKQVKGIDERAILERLKKYQRVKEALDSGKPA